MDVLREEYGIVPAGMLGHSAGEIACGYADGALTRGQTVRRWMHPVLCPGAVFIAAKHSVMHPRQPELQGGGGHLAKQCEHHVGFVRVLWRGAPSGQPLPCLEEFAYLLA